MIFALLLATMVALLVATILRCRREGAAWGCLVPKKAAPEPWGGASLWPPRKVLSSLAFGSCSAYDVRQQPIWEQASWGGCTWQGQQAHARRVWRAPEDVTGRRARPFPCLPALWHLRVPPSTQLPWPHPTPLQGIIPSQPDAWVWLGDMFYADEASAASLPGPPLRRRQGGLCLRRVHVREPGCDTWCACSPV